MIQAFVSLVQNQCMWLRFVRDFTNCGDFLEWEHQDILKS
jgi:hypothetical protein